MANKQTIKLRSRALSDGSKSLYLDIYINGQRRYEYLKLYIIPEVKRGDKAKNTQTMMLAEAIRGQRLVELQKGTFGFDDNFSLDTNFLAYYRALVERKHGVESVSNWGNWRSALLYLEDYCHPHTTFRDITPRWVEGFRDFLDRARVRNHHIDKEAHPDSSCRPLSQNSKLSYYRKLKACLNQAVRDRIIPHNPCYQVDGFKEDQAERVFLTIDEVKAMAATECRYPVLKRAFLFSCLTGLRKSDVIKLKWGDVTQVGKFTRITFKQQKTKGLQYLDINPQAAELLGEPGPAEQKVFVGFTYNNSANVALNQWAMRAGIHKHLSYHCSRHTFALMMLTLGTDFYTLSRLMGHTDIKSTMTYAHVMDMTKQRAVSNIPQVLGLHIDEGAGK